MNDQHIDVLHFIRRDGPANAPFVFLSIEDGGGFDCEQGFKDYFARDPVQIPSQGRKYEFGTPGVIIPKIMTCLLNGHFNEWERYREETLYRQNEMNIRFHPIARRGVREWQPFFTTLTGLCQQEYGRRSREERPALIAQQYGDVIRKATAVIVLGAFPEWRSVLKNVLGPFEHQPPAPEDRWGLYLNESGNLSFTEFSMFQRPRDADITEFCKRLTPYLKNQ